MTYSRMLLITVLGIGTIVGGLAFRYHIVRVRAEKLAHVVPPAPYFPLGSIWTQDISRAPLDPQSSTMINWLADAGGWGHGRMQVDFSIRVMQADANTPFVPTRKGSGFYYWNSGTSFPPFRFLPEAAWKDSRVINVKFSKKATATSS